MRFDLADYKQRTARLVVDDLDFEAFARQPLSPATLRCLRYMHDVEHHTVCYLRDLLLTPAHGDPEVTAFLTFWNFEEFWHGDALRVVLEAHGEVAGNPRLVGVRSRDRRPRPWAMLASTIGPALMGRDFTAVHMTWGAVNEWTTQAAYGRLIARDPHPVLRDLLSRIMRQEGRHIDFYASHAATQLVRSKRARTVTRFALDRFWRPVGSGVMPAGETRFLVSWLFGGDDGLDVARRIDRRIDRLSGLSGLRAIERARSRALTAT